MTSNEIRQVIGMKPSDDPKADELNNSNLYSDPAAAMPMEEEMPMDVAPEEEPYEEEDPGSIPISEIMN